MNLDELQSVQARERQSSDLQHLRSSFYREVGEFIQELTERRAQAVDGADDPFSSQEVRRLSDDIETAEQTVEAIYERRVGKVVKKASIAAAGMPVDDDGLTEEEEALFEDLVSRIEENRETVLAVLDGDAPTVSCSIDEGTQAGEDATAPSPDHRSPESTAGSEPEGGPQPDGVSAADLMGSGPDGESADDDGPPDGAEPDAPERERPSPSSREPPTGDRAAPGRESDSTPTSTDDPLATDAAVDRETDRPPEPEPEPEPPGEASTDVRSSVGSSDEADPTGEGGPSPATGEREIPNVPRTTVRITADVGEVVGAADRDYDLGPEDVVTLPEPNADVLVEKDAAERLE